MEHHSASVFKKTYQDYLTRLAALDLKSAAQKTGCEWTGSGLTIPLFGRLHTVSKTGILDPQGNDPPYPAKVVLCQYLLLHPDAYPKEQAWVSFKDFKGAAPLAHTYHVTTESEIAAKYAHRLTELEQACLALKGRPIDDAYQYDLKLKIPALPRVPLLLLFNDADNEFPAKSLLLFEQRAEHYLDMECLAILGRLLAEMLVQSSKNTDARMP